MLKKLIFTLILITFAFGMGCASRTMKIKVANPALKEIFINIKGVKDVQVGNTYTVYRTYWTTSSSSGGHAGHGGGGGGGGLQSYKAAVGKIKITRVIDEKTAMVEVIQGEANDGDFAEK